MDNNDILIRLRYAIDISDIEMVEIFKLGGLEVTVEEVRKILIKSKSSYHNEVVNHDEIEERVENIKSFYLNLVSYLAINIILVIVNYLTTPNYWWFYWVTIFWGLAVILHGAKVFITDRKLGKKWEEKKIKEEMKK